MFAPVPIGPMVDYPAVWALKSETLQRFRPDVPDLSKFTTEGGQALQHFALFQAIAERHPRLSWQDWPSGLHRPDSAEAQAFARAHADRIDVHIRVQALCDRQLADAVSQSDLRLGLIRDLAIGCAPDGAEAWSLGPQLAQGPSVGAPPDPFSTEGQVWGLPPPVPHLMAEGGYASFATLLATNLRHAAGLRIDHAMGLARLFWVPQGARGRDGAYVRYPFADVLGEIALASHRANAIIIGEDLGTVPDGFRETLAAQNILATRLLLLERDGAAFRPPATYPALAVAGVSTHDLPTFKGWETGADIKEQADLGLLADPALAQDQRTADIIRLRMSLPTDTGDLLADAHAMVAAAPSLLMLVQADDLAGEAIAVNLPGTDRERPNWRRRLAPDSKALFDGQAGQAILTALRSRMT